MMLMIGRKVPNGYSKIPKPRNQCIKKKGSIDFSDRYCFPIFIKFYTKFSICQLRKNYIYISIPNEDCSVKLLQVLHIEIFFIDQRLE